jgi:uncharacterized SAM-binding protein YcdF (DUF218 family)
MESQNPPVKVPGKPKVKGCLWVFVTLLFVILISTPFILRAIGEKLTKADPLEPANMAVALSGDEGDRVKEAALLLRNGYVDGIIITYTSKEARDALIADAVHKEISGGKIYVTYATVTDTVEEAKAVKDITGDHTWDSLIVITDPFHVLRTRIIFRDVFQDTRISIQVRPVPDHWYHADSWWKTRKGIIFTLEEYAKIILYHFGKY